MKTNYLTRPQIALVLIGHIFEELDIHEIANVFTTATGIPMTPAGDHPEVDDLWVCKSSFDELADSSLPKLLDYLRDVLNR